MATEVDSNQEQELPPLLQGAPDPKDFQIQEQIEPFWCWAAVASSIDEYYNTSPTFQTQCQLVGKVLGRTDCCPNNATNNATINAACNTGGATDQALLKAGRLASPALARPLEFTEVQQQISQDCLIGCGLGDAGDAHAVVIYDCSIIDGVKKVVSVQDPLGQTPRLLNYAVFRSAIHPLYRWKRTYLTTRAPQGVAALLGAQGQSVPPLTGPDLSGLCRHASSVLESQPPHTVAAGNSNLFERHRIYTASVQDVLKGNVLTNASFVSFRRLLFAPGASENPLGATEFEEQDGTTVVVSVSNGPSTVSSFQALQEASLLREVVEGECEPIYLKIVGLSIVALWFHYGKDNKDLSQDRVIPLAPTIVLPVGTSMSAVAFSKVCVGLAVQRGVGQP